MAAMLIPPVKSKEANSLLLKSRKPVTEAAPIDLSIETRRKSRQQFKCSGSSRRLTTKKIFHKILNCKGRVSKCIQNLLARRRSQ